MALSDDQIKSGSMEQRAREKKLLLESPARETHRSVLPSLANEDCDPGFCVTRLEARGGQKILLLTSSQSHKDAEYRPFVLRVR